MIGTKQGSCADFSIIQKLIQGNRYYTDHIKKCFNRMVGMAGARVLAMAFGAVGAIYRLLWPRAYPVAWPCTWAGFYAPPKWRPEGSSLDAARCLGPHNLGISGMVQNIVAQGAILLGVIYSTVLVREYKNISFDV